MASLQVHCELQPLWSACCGDAHAHAYFHMLLSADPEQDGTDGFFVAVLERAQEAGS